MTTLRWVVCILTLVAGTWVMALNWYLFWKGWVRREKTASVVPLLGAILMACSLYLVPRAWFRSFAWLPFLIDWGSVPVIAAAFVKHSQRKGDVSPGRK
jgi:hypothetical protein